jgi:hypothetical protein
VLQFHHPAVSGAMKPLVGSGDSDSSWTLLEVAGLLDVDCGISDSKLCRGPGNWTMVQKGLDCEVLVYAQSNFSVILFSEFSFSCILLQASTTTTRKCNSGVMLSWSTSSVGQILLSGFMLILWSTRCCAQILVTSQGTRRYSMEQDYCLVFVAEIVETVGWQNGSNFGDGMDDRAQHGYHHLTEMISFERILTVFFVHAVNTAGVVDSVRWENGCSIRIRGKCTYI